MTWWGSATGAILGGMLGGPIGGMVGAYAGHAVASWISSAASSEDILRVAAAVYRGLAKADGAISPREQERIEQFLNEDNKSLLLSVDAETLRRAVHNGAQDEKRLEEAFGMLPQNRELAITLLRRCFRIAAADLTINDAELRWLADFARRAGVSDDDFGVMSLLYHRSLEWDATRRKAYDDLGVSRGATHQEINEAYRSLARKYHPDRHVDIPTEIRDLTARKFSEITHAYEALMTPDRWWGKNPESKMPRCMSDRETVQCFSCSRTVRLPPAEHHWSARCPECQVLLLFPEDVATALAANTEDTKTADPTSTLYGRCPHCGKGYVATASALGSKIDCQSCKKSFEMDSSNSWA